MRRNIIPDTSYLIVYGENSPSRAVLRLLAEYLNEQVLPNKMRFEVKDIFYDYGANWSYTAIVSIPQADYDGNRSDWQTLNPHTYAQFLRGNIKADDVADELFNQVPSYIPYATVKANSYYGCTTDNRYATTVIDTVQMDR